MGKRCVGRAARSRLASTASSSSECEAGIGHLWNFGTYDPWATKGD
jgi:hypothetical protein